MSPIRALAPALALVLAFSPPAHAAPKLIGQTIAGPFRGGGDLLVLQPRQGAMRVVDPVSGEMRELSLGADCRLAGAASTTALALCGTAPVERPVLISLTDGTLRPLPAPVDPVWDRLMVMGDHWIQGAAGPHIQYWNWRTGQIANGPALLADIGSAPSVNIDGAELFRRPSRYLFIREPGARLRYRAAGRSTDVKRCVACGNLRVSGHHGLWTARAKLGVMFAQYKTVEAIDLRNLAVTTLPAKSFGGASSIVNATVIRSGLVVATNTTAAGAPYRVSYLPWSATDRPRSPRRP